MDSKKIYSSIGQVASIYDVGLSLTGYKKSVQDFISQLPFATEATFKALDAGCGTGLYSIAILEQYPNAQITAFDLDSELVKHLRVKVARKKVENRTNLFVADIQSELKEIYGQKFDLIITAGVLEYVPPKKTIQNLARFLVPGGYFFNSPVRNNSLGKLVCKIYACKPYSRIKNIGVFEESGFTLQKVIERPWYSGASFKEGHLFIQAKN